MGKEDTKKALGLIGAIVAVFVCAGWRIVGATAKPTPAPVAADAQATTTPATDESETPGPEKVSEDDLIEVPSTFAMGSNDPFKWLVKPDSVRFAATKPFGSSMPLGGGLPSGPLTPLPAASGFKVEAAPAKEPEVRLTGVLPGANAVAVVEVGDASYVVRRGERFAGGYTVDTIGTDRIAVVRGGKRTRLVLGE